MTVILSVPVDEGPGRKCGTVDPMSGAVCTRNTHVVDQTHWDEDLNFKIVWVEVKKLIEP